MKHKIIKKLILIFNYTIIILKSVKQYYKEFLFFLQAKHHYMGDDYPKSNPALLLRKRAHHLERYLFMPKAYSERFAKNAFADLEKVISRENNLPDHHLKWARKIIAEFKNSSVHDNIACPMLKNEVQRKTSPLTTDQFQSLIRSRRSRRCFENIPLTLEEKNYICEATQQIPSSCNRQTLYLIFVENPSLKEFVSATVPGGYQFFSQAPCILLILSDAGDYRYPDDRMVPYIEGAAAVQNIYLLCETMGLGCCWGSYTSFGSIKNEREVRKKLNIPGHFLIVASMAIGRSRQFVCDIPRDNPKNRYWTDYYGAS